MDGEVPAEAVLVGGITQVAALPGDDGAPDAGVLGLVGWVHAPTSLSCCPRVRELPLHCLAGVYVCDIGGAMRPISAIT